MMNEFKKTSLRQNLEEQLAKARRELRTQEQRLAHLKYEWGIAKRLRTQAPTEDEREKWYVQSDAYLGLVMQQENFIEQIQENIDRHRCLLTELDAQMAHRA
jgi:hypothetical protein